jgi:hypothetical protein
MKHVMAIFVALFWGGTLVSAHAGPLVNGDFESGRLAPWVQGIDASDPFAPGAAWSVAAGAAHTGSFGATAINNFEIRQDFAPIAVSDIGELSFWVRHPLDQTGALALITLFYSNGFEDFFPAITDSPAWTFFDITSFLTPGLQLSGISVFGFTAGNTAVARTDLDDVTLALAVPEPAAWLLLLAGGAAVARARRRLAVPAFLSL